MVDGSSITLAALGGTALAILGQASALGVGAVFTQAAFAKLRHRELLVGVIANYRLLPAAVVSPAAHLLPFIELFAGFALLFVNPRIGAPIAIVLLAIFAAAMGINIARGRREIDCGCGRSELRQPLSWPLVVRNLVLAALLVPHLGSMPSLGFSSSINNLIALAGGLAIVMFVQLFNAIGALAASPLAALRRQ